MTPSSTTTTSSAQDVRTFAGGASLSLLGNVFGRTLEMGLQIYLARQLGSQAFGAFAFGLNLLRILALFTPLGWERGVIRFSARYPESRPIITRWSLAYTLGTGSVVGGLLFASADWWAYQYHDPTLAPVLRWFALAIPLLSGMTVALAATTLSRKMQYSILARDIVQPLLNWGAIFLLVWLDHEKLSAVNASALSTLSFAIGFALALLFIYQLTPNLYQQQHTDELSVRTIFAYTLPTMLAALFVNLTTRLDRLAVSYFISIEANGHYQAAAQTAILFAIIMGSLNGMFIPMLSHLYEKGEKARLQQLAQVVTKWTFYLTIPLFVLIFLAPQLVLTSLFGREYGVAALALQIMAVGQLFNAATGAVGPLLIMTGQQRTWLRLALIALILTLVGNILFIRWWGLAGAALSTSLTLIFLFSSGLIIIHRQLHIQLYDARYLKGFAAMLISGAFVALLRPMLSPSALSLALLLLVSTSSFAGVLALLGWDEEDHTFLQLLRNKVTQR